MTHRTRNLILISDIFGRTPALEALGETLADPAPDIVDPYGGDDLNFKSEALAYAHFSAHVGLDRYVEILKNRLDTAPSGTVLIGFSVGATALWQVSADPRLSSMAKGFCFYGSRIRNHPDITPRFDLDLIFPRTEPHFEVGELIRTLEGRSGVTCTRARGLHGFMNRLSPNFDAGCCDDHVQKLKAELSRI